MSTIFGAVRQIAYVTRDIKGSMGFLAETCGVGPWFYAERITPDPFLYRGVKCPVEISVAIANTGKLQIELIQQLNDVPSMYKEWLKRHPGGELVQHMSSWTEGYEETLRQAWSRGFETVHEGRSSYGPFVYLQHKERSDFVFEVTKLTPARRFIFEAVAKAAESWDARDPIRYGWPVPPPELVSQSR